MPVLKLFKANKKDPESSLLGFFNMMVNNNFDIIGNGQISNLLPRTLANLFETTNKNQKEFSILSKQISDKNTSASLDKNINLLSLNENNITQSLENISQGTSSSEDF